jgi:hypothetical protein
VAAILGQRQQIRIGKLFCSRTIVGSHLMDDRCPSSALSKNGDTVGITAEVVDILLDPLQGHALIVKCGIRDSILLERRSRKPSEGS